MKLFKKILLFLPIICILVLVNYKVDPLNYFDDSYSIETVRKLNEGKNVTNLVNLNERLFQKYRALKTKTCPSTLIFGSSHMYLFNDQNLKEEKLSNCSVASATLEDIIGIYSVYHARKCKIKKVIIGVEPYFLNDNHNQLRWKHIEKEYYELACQLFEGKSPNFLVSKWIEMKRYRKLFSISYFGESVKFLRDRSVKNRFTFTSKKLNRRSTILSNGFKCYGKDNANRTDEDVIKRVKSSIKKMPTYNLKGFYKHSNHYKKLLTAFIRFLKRNNTQIEFYISPYNPLLYDFIKKNRVYNLVLETESFYRRIAKRHQIKIMGSLNPYKYDLKFNDFFDATHSKPQAIAKILKKDK